MPAAIKACYERVNFFVVIDIHCKSISEQLAKHRINVTLIPGEQEVGPLRFPGKHVDVGTLWRVIIDSVTSLSVNHTVQAT